MEPYCLTKVKLTFCVQFKDTACQSCSVVPAAESMLLQPQREQLKRGDYEVESENRHRWPHLVASDQLSPADSSNVRQAEWSAPLRL